MIRADETRAALRYAYVKEGATVSEFTAVDPSEMTSGPDVFVAELLFRLDRSDLLVAARTGPEFFCQNRRVQALRLAREGRSAKSFLSELFVLWRLVVALRRFRPARLICGSLGPVLWASFLFSKLKSIPMVQAAHVRIADSQDRRLTRLRSAVDLWCLRRLEGIVCHGPYLKNHLLQLGVSIEAVVEFEVDLRGTTPRPSKLQESLSLSESSDAIRVLYMGRLEEQKGVLDLLAALAPDLRKSTSLRLVFAGDGPAQQKLRDAATSLDVLDKVEFLGQLAHADLVQVISRVEIVVTPTQRQFPEGRCMAAVEALLLGIPVVAPDFGPFPFAVRDGQNGLLFKPDSVVDLRAKIRTLLQDSELYAKIKSGAVCSSDMLFQSHLTFSEAIESAFAASVSSRTINPCRKHS